MCKLYQTSYTCTHALPIELFPCGSQIAAFACLNGIEIILLPAPKSPRGKGKCRDCRRKDAERWREGKPPLDIVKVEEKADKKEAEEEVTIKVEKEDMEARMKAAREDMKARIEEVKRKTKEEVRVRTFEIGKKVEKEEENRTPRPGKWFGW